MPLPAEPQVAADVALVIFDFSNLSLCNLLSQGFGVLKKTKLKPNLRITQFPYGQISW